VDQSYWAKYSKDVQFVPPSDLDYATAVACDNLGITIAEMERIEKSFRDAKSLEDLFKTDLIYTEMKVLIDAIVGRELVRAQPRKTIPEMVHDKSKLKIGLCRFIAKNIPCKYGEKCQFSHHVPKANIMLLKTKSFDKNNVKPKMSLKKKMNK
jgi:hypothetical protein